MIDFGPWSTTLAFGMGFGLAVALLLLATRRNRAANVLLAGVLVVVSLKLAPYMLGFAGYYDAYPWLSFAPTSLGLALGPLLWLHVQRLTTGRLPASAGWHLLPGALQAAYYLVLFPLPQADKDDFATQVDGPWIDPLETWLELASLAVYLVLAWRQHRRYQAWLDQTFSNREQFRLDGLRQVLLTWLAVLPVWAGFELASALGSYDYFQRYPLYFGLTLLLAWLGLQGWRNAALDYPVPADAPPPGPQAPPAPTATVGAASPANERDWAASGNRWRDQLAAAGWWRDPELSLPRLAQHLGTNTHYLSRAFNEGLGQSFNDVINALRVQAVREALDGPSPPADLLALALSVGFNAKSSFNRVFKAQTGLTPSAYRARAGARGAKS